MDYSCCPGCGALNPPEAERCGTCQEPLPPPGEARTVTPFPLSPADEPPPAAEAAPAAPAAPPPPPFEAPPEVKARAEALEKKLAETPGARAVYLQLAQLYADAKRKDLAAAVLQRGLSVEPGNVYLRHRLAQLTGTPDRLPSSVPAPAGARTTDRPAVPDLRGRWRPTRRQQAWIAGSLALVVLVVVLKVWVFPTTRVLVTGDFRAFAPCFSPTGEHLAFLRSDAQGAQIAVYDFRKGAHRVLGETAAGDARDLAWSPDGTRLAHVGPGGDGDWGGAIHVVDVATGESRRLAAGGSPVWSEDGRSLVATCRPDPSTASSPGDWRERLCRIDAGSGTVEPGQLFADYGMVLSGSGKALHEKTAEAADAAPAPPDGTSGDDEFQEMADAVVAGGATNFAEGSRDLSRELQARQYMERRKAAAGTDKLPYVSDVVVSDIGGDSRQVTSDGQSAFPSWASDGRILFATNGARGIEMWTMNPDGTDRQMVLSGARLADPATVTLTRDGRTVFFVSPVEASEGLAQVMTGETPADLFLSRAGSGKARRVTNRHSFKQRFSVSPDGSRVAYEVLTDVRLVGGAQTSEIWLTRP